MPAHHAASRCIALLFAGLAALWPATSLAAGTTMQLFPYWADGQPLTWYNFGARSPVKDGVVQAQSEWIMITRLDAKGQPIEVPGQFDIMAAKPGDPGYSDLDQIILVQAPAGYTANTFKSRADVEASGAKQTITTQFVNAPSADLDDRLAGVDQKPEQGWVDGQPVWYFELGPAVPRAGKEWRFITGYDAQNKPQFVAGQYTVSDLSPSPFRDVSYVQVPAGYVPNSIKTVAQVQASGFPIISANSVVNVPLPPAQPVASQGRTPAVYGIIGLLAAAWLAGSVYLLRLPAPRPLAAQRETAA